MSATTGGPAHTAATVRRRRPVGAEVTPGGVHFCVWAPKHEAVAVVLESGPGSKTVVPLEAGRGGFFAGAVEGAAAGTRYRYRLGEGPDARDVADPASRFQPEGPHGPSEVVDPSAFAWSDADWRGPAGVEGQVLYELHLGTFTPEGTYAAAADQLPFLASLGVTAVELMPVAEFPGRFGWSYDGVDLFAPFHHYGTPDDFRRFVDRAHALGLAVLLDVVYNHLGPEGNVLPDYADCYFSAEHDTEWGEALNFDGEHCSPVREFVTANAAAWVDEYHVDGVRVDATQSLFDTSGDHIVRHLARAIKEAAAASGRRALVVGESEPQRAALLRPESAGGYGFDLLWSDDFHHAACVAATGAREGYYGDYLGTPQELISALKRGWLYQGQWNLRQGKRRGSPALDLPAAAFLSYLQNHDQLANSAYGHRLHRLTTPGRYRAVTALQLLGPATPLLFQGQEYAAPQPFLYFGDLRPEVARTMHEGRREFVRQFPSLATSAMQARVPDPSAEETFRGCVLDPADRDKPGCVEALALHRDLLRLRREDPTLRAGQRRGAIDGAVLGPEAFVVRWFDPAGEGDDRLLLVNLGAELRLRVAAEPLLAPSGETDRWRVVWSTDDPRYGGGGVPDPETEENNWVLSAHAATLLAPTPAGRDEHRDARGSV